ncbi:MAG TPA: HlyD family efflux transporter periplasmic adaptor subunit, partial [Burkholderiales bacterium]
IDEADVGRLRTGMPVSFAVDAFPRRSFSGEIRQIRKSPQNVQNVVSYTVVISAANPDLALLPGMTANVRVQVDSRASALKVPNAALRWRPAGAAAEPAPQEGAPAAKGQGAGQAAQFRERLMKELKPSDTQKAQLDDIFAESRRRFATLRELGSETERRREMERIRADASARISQIVTAEQRPAWEKLLADSGGRGQASSGRLWVLRDGEPRPVEVRLGLSDGTSTELVGGTLSEGAEVIVGLAPSGGNGGAGLPRFRLF